MAKKSPKLMRPFCQTIKVVMSPKGENAPPALAAMTILMHANVTNLVFLPPTAMATADINKAVVRLSAIGEMKNDKIPVTQKIALKDKPRLTR